MCTPGITCVKMGFYGNCIVRKYRSISHEGLNGPAIAEHPASQPQTAHQTTDYFFLRNSWTTGGHQASKPRDAYQTRGFTYTVKTTQTVKYLLIPI